MQCSKPPPRTAGSMHSTAAGSTAPQIRRFLPWPGTRGDFGPWRVCSLDEFSEPKDDLKGSLKCRLKNKPQAPGGGSNVSHPLIADRRRRFARKKSKLNTNSPPPGGGSNLCSLSLCGPAGLQRADFFPSSPNFRAPHRSRAGGFSLQINVRLPRRAPIQRFISRPLGAPKGTSNLCGLSVGNRWSGTHFSARVMRSKNRREIHLGGGSHWPALR
jgi:hypothetical protein